MAPEISAAINENGIVAAAVLSGNRNFEGRVSPDVQANYLASPPLVVAYALAGTVQNDLSKEPLGTGSDGQPVYLKDIWPTSQEIQKFIVENITRELFLDRYADVFNGDASWRAIATAGGETYAWDDKFNLRAQPALLRGHQSAPDRHHRHQGRAHPRAVRRQDHHRPHLARRLHQAGVARRRIPAGAQRGGRRLQPVRHPPRQPRSDDARHLRQHPHQEPHGARCRRQRQEGGLTVHYPTGEAMSIFDAAMRYKAEGVPLVVFAGNEYGNGSSRDWAAKGTKLLGVRAVIAQSFERIHRSNLVGMGVVPFVFEEGTNWQSLGLKGDEMVNIPGLTAMQPRQMMTAEIIAADGSVRKVPILCRIDTLDELEYFRNGGILHYVLRNLAAVLNLMKPSPTPRLPHGETGCRQPREDKLS